MTVIDDKVVAMSFDNSKFQSGVSQTISSLDKLKAALHLPGAAKGLQDLDAASKKVDLSHISRGVEEVQNKLQALRLIAIGVFSQLAAQAIRAGGTFVKAFTIGPAKAGFQEYTTNLNAVQTILANTQAAGAGLKDVNAALDELNRYSDKTIYNFSQMARNIGTFTAAGVDLKTATASIKGIANLAALSGSNAEQASTAMYQLSQAIASGSVKLMDWNSVVNAGMGGTVFQRALAQTAEHMGTLKKGTVELVGPMKNVKIAGESFRNSLSAPGKDGWLTSKVLTETLQLLTSDLTDAELRAKGWNESQIKAIQQQAKTAMLAATTVKTLTGVMEVAKETAGSGWAKTWQLVFGDFEEAKVTFTGLSNAINSVLIDSARARNNMLSDWKELGGRTAAIDAIKSAFKSLGQILAPIKEAFREFFPAKTGADLMYLTQLFERLVEKMKPSAETIANLKSTFSGFFAVLDIGWEIIKGVIGVFADLVGATGAGGGGFLNFTANIGDSLVAFHKWLIEGGKLAAFFDRLGSILAAPIDLLRAIAKAVSDLFSGFSPGGFFQEIGGMNNALTPLQKIMAGIATGWGKLLEAIGNSGKMLRPAFEAIIELISGLGSAIGNATSNMNFDAILQVIRTGLFAGLVLMFKQFLGKGSLIEQIAGKSGGFLGQIRGKFMALQGAMQSLQTNLKAKTLKEIAIAIALLTASVVALSFVDPAKLTSALTAMAVGFGQLLAAMGILTAVTKTAGFVKLPLITASMILLATAIDVLSLAVIALSLLSWESLLKGLSGVAVLLATVSAAAIPLSANSAGMIRAGVGIMAIALALKVLASAVADFGEMSWTEMAKGLAGVAIGLTIMSAAALAMPKSMIITGVGLIALATGLKILAGVVQTFGSMDLKSMGKGLLGIGGSLAIIAAAMHLMPKSTIIIGVGLIVVAEALKIIAGVVKSMGGRSIEQLAKGLISLGAALLILAVGLHAMSGTIGGAVALGIAAAGLSLLVPALIALGQQSWPEIIKSMVALAAAMALIGIAGALVMPAIPALLGFGVALVLVGAGLALAGVGIALIGVGLASIAVSGPLAVGILIASLLEFLEAIPKIVQGVVLGLLEMVKAFAATAPMFVDAMVKIFASLVDVIIKSSPKIAEAFNALIALALKVLYDNQNKIIQAGFDLIVAFLKGIKNNIPQLVTLTIDIIVKFLSTISSNLGRIIASGTDLLLAFLKGIGNNLNKIITTVAEIIVKFINGLSSNWEKIRIAGTNMIIRIIEGITRSFKNVTTAGVNAIVAFVTGIGDAGEKIVTAARTAAGKFIKTLSAQIVALADDVFDALIGLIQGMTNVINENAPLLRNAGLGLGWAIINGMTFGLLSKAEDLYATAKGIAAKTLSIVSHPWRALSPSKTMIELGANIIAGLTKGLNVNASQAYESAKAMSNGVINAFKNTFQITSPSKVMMEIGKLVGQGFANGLKGSSTEINSAFKELNDKLTETMKTARETIASEQEKLNKLLAETKPDAAAIKAAQTTIKENQDILARSTAGHIALIKTLKDEHTHLNQLANEFDKVSEKLGLAKDVLAAATKTRDEAIKGFSDQYSTLPALVDIADGDGNPVDQLAAYLDSLKNQTAAVGAYQATLDQLRKLGLDDATYQKLLRDGTADQQFASQLLAGGKTAVDSLNTLDKNLMTVSKTLATNAAKNLYQAGVDAAEGLVKGLQSKKSKLRDAMEDLAREMLIALKKELKIKSPSEEFAKIGAFAMAGMAQGFSRSSKVVTDAIDIAAQDALTAMQRSMRDISDVVTDGIDTNPVITPILDLTQVRSKTEELAALATTPLTAAASFDQASLISSEQTAAQAENLAVAAGGTSLKFEQNNYSPESLSEIEIYRQTRNQLSQLKSVLALT